MRMKATTKSLLCVSSVVALGVIVINTIIFWHNTGFRFSIDILNLSVPAIVFTWLTTALCGVGINFAGRRGSIASAIVLVALHLAALLYFLFALSSWREGTEFARLFVIQLTFATIILCFWFLRQLLKKNR
jgi:hypothetical protein